MKIGKETRNDLIQLAVAYLGIGLMTLDAINGWIVTNSIIDSFNYVGDYLDNLFRGII